MKSIIDRIDKGILLTSLILMGFGIVFVYSSSFAVAEQKFGGAYFFLARHIIRALLGIIALVVFMNYDYHKVGMLSKYAFVVGIVMLIYVLVLPDSSAINGSKRWIDLGFIRFQVSEFARISMIIAVSYSIYKSEKSIKDRDAFLIHFSKVCIITGLIVFEPDYSTAMLTGILGVAILFVAGARIMHIGAIVLVMLPIAIWGVFSTPYRYKRLMGFWDLSNSKSGIGYQTYQSLVGLGTGGIFGSGLGQGKQKYFFLPEPHTDFVFSMIGEEVGFVGLLIILLLFAYLIFRGIKTSIYAPDALGKLVAFGITFVISLYLLLHIAVNTGLVPTTGVPLPFLSYGGMSLVFNMSCIGIILNISSQTDYARRVRVSV